MKLKRVVVTGLGALTPIGNNISEYWNALINGVSGAATIARFDPTDLKTRIACEVKNYNPLDFFDRRESRRLDACSQYGLISSEEAIKNSGLDLEKINKDRTGVIWAAGIGGLDTFEYEARTYNPSGPTRFSPFFIPKMIADITAGHISIKYGFRGPNFATVSACASSANATADAYHYIQLGKADIIVAGGSEAAINRIGVGGFSAMHAISQRNDDPKTASRPFDKDRDGFVLGEGGGTIIFEELEHALARGVKIYAEICGSGLTADAFHITSPHPEGEGAKLAMFNAINEANLKPTDIDHINTHGTSTPLGDIAESIAITNLFGDYAPKININSTKSMTGHLLGAAGSIESIATILAVKNDIIPPTINHFTDDPDINNTLNYTFHKAIKRTVNVALTNTFGFGGHNVSLLFKKFNG